MNFTRKHLIALLMLAENDGDGVSDFYEYQRVQLEEHKYIDENDKLTKKGIRVAELATGAVAIYHLMRKKA